MGHIVGYTAAEYLQQHAGRSRRSASVPASLWLSCREFLTSPRDLRAMALSALSRWLFTESELLYRRLSAVTGAPLDLMLTALMARQHRLDELRSLAESGDVNASAQLHLFTNDEHDEAPDEQDETPPVEDQHQVGGQEEPAGMEGAFKETIIRLRALHENELRDRATTGDGRAMRELATLLTRQGRESELRARADTDDPFAARALADLLAHHGREQELRDRIAAGDLAAGEGLLALLRLRHREAEADRLYLYGLLPDGSIATGPP
jgi:hypothetical protein